MARGLRRLERDATPPTGPRAGPSYVCSIWLQVCMNATTSAGLSGNPSLLTLLEETGRVSLRTCIVLAFKPM
jgi:hypothetical protein